MFGTKYQIPSYLIGPQAAASGPATGDATSDGATVRASSTFLFNARSREKMEKKQLDLTLKTHVAMENAHLWMIYL